MVGRVRMQEIVKNKKDIILCKKNIKELKPLANNPRIISKKDLEVLKKSIQENGDFGLFVIDEDNNIISGNQRFQALKSLKYNSKVDCKQLVGYSQEEKNAILIRANKSAGDWDFYMLDDLMKSFKDIDIELTGFNLDEANSMFFFEENQDAELRSEPILKNELQNKANRFEFNFTVYEKEDLDYLKFLFKAGVSTETKKEIVKQIVMFLKSENYGN
jgi:hypothetical protein